MNEQMDILNLFQPTFGNRPERYIEAPRRGELVFAVPYLKEYLQEDI